MPVSSSGHQTRQQNYQGAGSIQRLILASNISSRWPLSINFEAVYLYGLHIG